MKSKKNIESPLYGGSLFSDTSVLNVVRAKFLDYEQTKFDDLIAGYSSMRVLTYSNSVPIIKMVAETMDELEVIFGREDILGEMARYVQYQTALIEGIRIETQGSDIIEQKITHGKVRLYIVREILSHEKMFLLEGALGNRVITGSANFSEKAFSGNQNESYVCFDNDEGAWQFFSDKYEKIKANSVMSIAKKALLDDEFNFEKIPLFDDTQDRNNMPQIIVVQDKPPTPTIVQKIISQRLPKVLEGLSQIIESRNGVARIDRPTKTRAIQYIKSNSRTKEDNPQEYLSIHFENNQVVLSGKVLNLETSTQNLEQDVNLMIEYFEGYNKFRGDWKKLARDYFTFMSWFYISPFICDFRNRALTNLQDDIDHLDYPIFGILYGKSNCGKSELIRMLLLSMFQHSGEPLPNEWFTKASVANLRDENKRFPMFFDDLDKTRFSNHAIPLIKEDFIKPREYPGIVLSMNADKDTFETEVRKRCLVIYTGASLPDHTPEKRDLGTRIKRLKRNMGNALYLEYLSRVLSSLRLETPTDILEFSSRILHEIISENCNSTFPAWCRITSMDEYSRGKHDKVKNELLQQWQYTPTAWNEKGNKLILKLDDVHSLRKLKKDVPDYLVFSDSGDAIIFYKDELEAFLETPLSTKRKGFSNFFKRR